MTAKKTKKKLSDYIAIIVGVVLLALTPVVASYGAILWAGVAIAIILVGVVIATAEKNKKITPS